MEILFRYVHSRVHAAPREVAAGPGPMRERRAELHGTHGVGLAAGR
jgi:hypothetical protein